MQLLEQPRLVMTLMMSLHQAVGHHMPKCLQTLVLPQSRCRCQREAPGLAPCCVSRGPCWMVLQSGAPGCHQGRLLAGSWLGLARTRPGCEEQQGLLLLLMLPRGCSVLGCCVRCCVSWQRCWCWGPCRCAPSTCHLLALALAPCQGVRLLVHMGRRHHCYQAGIITHGGLKQFVLHVNGCSANGGCS